MKRLASLCLMLCSCQLLSGLDDLREGGAAATGAGGAGAGGNGASGAGASGAGASGGGGAGAEGGAGATGGAGGDGGAGGTGGSGGGCTLEGGSVAPSGCGSMPTTNCCDASIMPVTGLEEGMCAAGQCGANGKCVVDCLGPNPPACPPVVNTDQLPCVFDVAGATEAPACRFNCENGGCAGKKLVCPKAAPCVVNCMGPGACQNTVVVCPTSAPCSLCKDPIDIVTIPDGQCGPLGTTCPP